MQLSAAETLRICPPCEEKIPWEHNTHQSSQYRLLTAAITAVSLLLACQQMRTTASLLSAVIKVRVLTPSITLPSISTATESIFIRFIKRFLCGLYELFTETVVQTCSLRHLTVCDSSSPGTSLHQVLHGRTTATSDGFQNKTAMSSRFAGRLMTLLAVKCVFMIFVKLFMNGYPAIKPNTIILIVSVIT